MTCSGYYKYEHGYTPEFAGREKYTGAFIHPQLWPEDLDYRDKQVVVIGSGATAVTIVPEMAKTAAHVTMLQRSPTYVVSRPSEDKIANRLKKMLSARRLTASRAGKMSACRCCPSTAHAPSQTRCARCDNRLHRKNSATIIRSPHTSTRNTIRGTSACA